MKHIIFLKNANMWFRFLLVNYKIHEVILTLPKNILNDFTHITKTNMCVKTEPFVIEARVD